MQRLQKIHGSRVERRRERKNALVSGVREDLLVPFPRRVGLVVQVVETAPSPQLMPIREPEARGIRVDGDGVSRVRLQLDGVRARFSGHRDDVQRTLQVAVVVAAHLSDDERVRLRSDGHPANLDGLGHDYFPSKILRE